MNRAQYLLTCTSEECDEVGQRASKAVRFGLSEIQSGQDLTNAQRIVYEFNDLFAVMQELFAEGFIDKIFDEEAIKLKHANIEKWYRHSQREGQTEPGDPNVIRSVRDQYIECLCLTKTLVDSRSAD